jgi:phenylpropionate dioxygenase-like ring-hydroxylating dioxygenase large terminal subunit
MTTDQDNGKYQESKDTTEGRAEKFSRRDFARTTVAAAAVGIPGVAAAVSQSTDDTSPAEPASRSSVPATGDWQKGTTIPAEYYYEPEHYRKDERYVADNFWLLADHVSRIPNTGDFFVFKFGIGDSAIVLRDEAGGIRAFHNVCRHRGSRLCRHDEDPKPADERLSVRQLGESGNAKVFRCPYHGWMYDLDGSLMKAYDVADEFDWDANGLVACNVRTEEGHIFLNFSRGAAPEFESIYGYGFREVGANYRLADLKIGARQYYAMHANWKLALENFLECYHCGPAHENLVTTHNWNYSLSDARRRRWDGGSVRNSPPSAAAALLRLTTAS